MADPSNNPYLRGYDPTMGIASGMANMAAAMFSPRLSPAEQAEIQARTDLYNAQTSNQKLTGQKQQHQLDAQTALEDRVRAATGLDPNSPEYRAAYTNAVADALGTGRNLGDVRDLPAMLLPALVGVNDQNRTDAAIAQGNNFNSSALGQKAQLQNALTQTQMQGQNAIAQANINAANQREMERIRLGATFQPALNTQTGKIEFANPLQINKGGYAPLVNEQQRASAAYTNAVNGQDGQGGQGGMPDAQTYRDNLRKTDPDRLALLDQMAAGFQPLPAAGRDQNGYLRDLAYLYPGFNMQETPKNLQVFFSKPATANTLAGASNVLSHGKDWATNLEKLDYSNMPDIAGIEAWVAAHSNNPTYREVARLQTLLGPEMLKATTGGEGTGEERSAASAQYAPAGIKNNLGTLKATVDAFTPRIQQLAQQYRNATGNRSISDEDFQRLALSPDALNNMAALKALFDKYLTEAPGGGSAITSVKANVAPTPSAAPKRIKFDANGNIVQ